MAHEFVTLLRSDPEFKSYIEGSFSEKSFALPVDSYNVHSTRERVTFRILSKEKIQRPLWPKILWTAARPVFLTLGLGPLLTVWAFILSTGQSVSLLYAFSASFALLFLHLSVFLLNDYSDHVSGQDRLSSRRGSQVIQKGWMVAYQVRRLGYFCFLLGALAGLPALSVDFSSLSVIAGIGGLAILSYSFLNERWKSLGLSDFLLFCCLGPLLTYAYGLVISGQHSLELLFLGFVFGLGANLVFQLRQLEALFKEPPQRISSWIARLGFDRARVFLIFESVLLSILVLGFSIFNLEIYSLSLILLLPVLSLMNLSFRLYKASSPLSSYLISLWRWAALFHGAVALGFIIVFLGQWIGL